MSTRAGASWVPAVTAVIAALVVTAISLAAGLRSDRTTRVGGSPSGSPSSSTRACAARDVTAAFGDRDGAGGHLLRYVRFRNVGTTTCVLSGYPRVVAYESGLPPFTGTNGSFFPTGDTAEMGPGQDTYLGVETDSACAARPSGGPPGPAYHQLQITLPTGGTVTLVDSLAGFDVGCGLHLTRFFVLPVGATS